MVMREVVAKQEWDILEKDHQSVLIDVRTPMEWAQIGLPELESIGRSAFCITWQPGMEETFLQALAAAAPEKNTKLLFLCRSGMRSYNAGVLAEAVGYEDVTNIVDGFEDKHGPGTGWRAGGLPCAYRPLSGS